MDMRKRRLEWFGHVTRRDETVNIRAVSETKMEGKRPRGRRRLRWKDTVRRDIKAWKIREVWATDREMDLLPHTGRRRRRVIKLRTSTLECCWRVDHGPDGFVARVAGGGGAEVDGDEVVSLVLKQP